MTDPAPPPSPYSGAHEHDDRYEPVQPQVEVAQSQEIRTQLQPLVQELNRIIDRLEHLAGYDTHDKEPRPNGTAPAT